MFQNEAISQKFNKWNIFDVPFMELLRDSLLFVFGIFKI